MLENLKRRLIEIAAAPAEVARRAAPRIAERLKTDARTRRGNVPLYGKMGNIPITVEARPESITITAVDWVIEKAQGKGQIDEWVEIVKNEATDVLSGESGGRKT